MSKLGKSARIAEKKRLRNKPTRSEPKTAIDEVERLLAAKDIEGAEKKFREAQSSLNRGAKKGVLKLNNAARRQSRLIKKINTAKTTVKKA